MTLDRLYLSQTDALGVCKSLHGGGFSGVDRIDDGREAAVRAVETRRSFGVRFRLFSSSCNTT